MKRLNMTLEDIEKALDESGTKFFCEFLTANDSTRVKIRKKEARSLLELYGSTEAGEIKWDRRGKTVTLSAARGARPSPSDIFQRS